MSHEIEMIDGVAQHAYVGEVPWHGLGVRVEGDLPPDAMLRAAGLDWTVSKHKLFAEVNGTQIETSAEALIRDKDNKVLTIVTDSWKPFQNYEAFEFFNEYVQAGDMEMHTAGSLHGGRNVWALAKIKDSFFDVFGGDRTEGYLLFSNPHQFGKAIDIRFTPIRVVCNNTLTMSLNSKTSNGVRINHRNLFDPAYAKETLGIATSQMEKYKEMVEFIGSKKYTKETIVEYFNRVFPLTTNRDTEAGQLASRAAKNAFELLETQPGAQYASGSYWQAYNAVTYLFDHRVGRTADSRLRSSWFGGNQKKKVDALNLAVEMANAA